MSDKLTISISTYVGYAVCSHLYSNFHRCSSIEPELCPVSFVSKFAGIVAFSFAVGVVGFFKLLFPATRPDLFNDKTDDCSCWHGYCNW